MSTDPVRCSKLNSGIMAVAAVFALTVVQARANDWPCFRGPNRDGHTDEKVTIWPPQEVWRANVGEGCAQTVVSQGRVYAMGWVRSNVENVVWCFDEEGSHGTNPPPVWTNCYPCAGGHYQSDCYGTYPTPAVADGELYTDDNFSLLNCYSAATGALLWSNTTFHGTAGDPVWGGSPLIEGDLVVVNGGGDNGTAAISRTTHNVVWPAGAGVGGGWASPQAATIEGKRIIIGYGGRNVTGLDPATGNVLWYYPCWSMVHPSNFATPIMVGSTKLFLTLGYWDGFCVELNLAGASGLVTNLVWPQSGSLECEANTPVIYGNCAYSTDYREDLRCVDVSNGALKWNKSGFHWDGAVLSAGDQLIILTGGLTPDVVIAQASSDGYQELYRLTNAVPYSGNVHACTVSYPTLCNGKLYVHYPDGTLVCYQVGSSSNVTPPVISISPMSNQVGKIEFSWPSASGALYAVYRTTNLMLGWPAQPLTNNISGNGATMFFSESVGALPKAYYRLKAGN